MISYRLTENDIISANRLWWRYKMRPSLAVITILLVWAAFSLFEYHIRQETPFTALVIGAFIAACAALGIGYLAPRISARQTLRYFNQASNSTSETSAEWNDAHICFRQTGSYHELPWRDVMAWRENDDMMVLMRIGPMFNPIPKRAFASGQLEDLKASLTKARIPSGKASPSN